MQLFYAPDIAPPLHTLTVEESKHCVRVLRLAPGDPVHITDGRGHLFCCRIVEADPRRCRVEVVETINDYEKRSYLLAMAVAPTKNADRFEWFLEKATEVGVDRLIPLSTARSERRVYRPERGERIVTAAMKQSLKAFRPVLHSLTELDDVLGMPFDGRRLIAHCAPARSQAGKAYLPAALRPGEAALVLIGPEGDFSPEEIDRALACGFEEVTLGTARLRTETAAVAATVMVSVANAGAACGPEDGAKAVSKSLTTRPAPTAPTTISTTSGTPTAPVLPAPPATRSVPTTQTSPAAPAAGLTAASVDPCSSEASGLSEAGTTETGCVPSRKPDSDRNGSERPTPRIR